MSRNLIIHSLNKKSSFDEDPHIMFQVITVTYIQTYRQTNRQTDRSDYHFTNAQCNYNTKSFNAVDLAPCWSEAQSISVKYKLTESHFQAILQKL